MLYSPPYQTWCVMQDLYIRPIDRDTHSNVISNGVDGKCLLRCLLPPNRTNIRRRCSRPSMPGNATQANFPSGNIARCCPSLSRPNSTQAGHWVIRLAFTKAPTIETVKQSQGTWTPDGTLQLLFPLHPPLSLTFPPRPSGDLPSGVQTT